MAVSSSRIERSTLSAAHAFLRVVSRSCGFDRRLAPPCKRIWTNRTERPEGKDRRNVNDGKNALQPSVAAWSAVPAQSPLRIRADAPGRVCMKRPCDRQATPLSSTPSAERRLNG